MTFEVQWLPAAQDEFSAMLWEQKGQSALMSALESLSRQLAVNPYDTGESRQTIHDRVAIETPLRIYFRIMDNDRVVLISHMDWFGKPLE